MGSSVGCRDRGTQHLVPRDDDVQRSFECLGVEFAEQSPRLSFVVNGQPGIQLFENPQPPLPYAERAREPRIPRRNRRRPYGAAQRDPVKPFRGAQPIHPHGVLNFAIVQSPPDERGLLRDRSILEEIRERKRHGDFLPKLRHALHGEQRVTP